jgi:hypothetical protein
VCVPDLRVACEEYAKGHTTEALIILFGSPAPSYYAAHKWMYDRDTLTQLLKHAGFTAIEEQQFRQGVTPDLEFLDNYEGVTLRLEASKPA